jgi:hypothetical protein
MYCIEYLEKNLKWLKKKIFEHKGPSPCIRIVEPACGASNARRRLLLIRIVLSPCSSATVPADSRL